MQTIELTDTDAEAFLSFREHQEFIEKLVKADIQSLRNATAVLSFDSNGRLAKIKVEQVVFHGKE